jgi:hypothetical protein
MVSADAEPHSRAVVERCERAWCDHEVLLHDDDALLLLPEAGQQLPVRRRAGADVDKFHISPLTLERHYDLGSKL